MSLPWFRRFWIIQEAVLSHDVKFICGRRGIPRKDMSVFAICKVDNNLESPLNLGEPSERGHFVSGLTRTRMIGKMNAYEWAFPRQSSLLRAFVRGRGSQATDARDKVFSIMRMTATTLRPDYALPVRTVYSAAAHKI